MTEKLVRFGVAMESSLLEEFDQVVAARGGTRSEALRDFARAAVVRSKVRRGVEAVATLTLVYDHHVHDLSERLTELQHDLGEKIRSTLHIHLDHHHCLEVIVMQGRSDQLQEIADRIIALKGVKHGGIELYAGLAGAQEERLKPLPSTARELRLHRQPTPPAPPKAKKKKADG